MNGSKYLSVMILIILAVSFNNVLAEDADNKICTKFFSPFNEPERCKYQNIEKRCFSGYGEYRSSEIKGHKHSGIDLRGKLSENVYPIGVGKVYAVLWSFPYLAVVIIHPLPKDEFVYSLYLHIEDIRVKVGDWVDENTIIARLFNSEEFNESRYKQSHFIPEKFAIYHSGFSGANSG